MSGRLKVQIGDNVEYLSEGDSIYYNSSTPHGMISVEGEDCEFYAIVLNPTGEPIPELSDIKPDKAPSVKKAVKKDETLRIYHNYTPTFYLFL